MHHHIARRIRDHNTENELIGANQRIAVESLARIVTAKRQERLLRAKEEFAATHLAALVRGFLARCVFRRHIIEKKAAVSVQRIVRGLIGRRKWKKEFYKSVSVVKSAFALELLLSRSRLLRESIQLRRGFGKSSYHWQELFDPLTCTL